MNQKWHESKWEPELKWDTEGGILLKKCIETLVTNLPSPPEELIIFGSVPLQMGVSPGFLSSDVDIATREEIASVLNAKKMLKGQSAPYIEISEPDVFIASTDWQSRAHKEKLSGILLIFPHPIDILVSKVNRCENKDINAFLEVIQNTGHPTEEELKESLQRVVDIYRPTFDEEGGTDATLNTQTLWKSLFNKAINVRSEIIIPAMQRKLRAREAPGGVAAKKSLIRISTQQTNVSE